MTIQGDSKIQWTSIKPDCVKRHADLINSFKPGVPFMGHRQTE